MQKNLIFFLLVLLLPWIRTKSDNETKEEKIASRLQLKNNLGKIPGESAIITANTVNDERPDDNHVGKVSDKNKQDKKKYTVEYLQRKSRNAFMMSQEMECVSCYGAGISTSDENCYNGYKSKTVKCADAETCFTELHPQYIKRGCMLPTGTNRTFVCKCPLCNDKPSQDPTYYEYKTINDWKYDNERLTQSVVGLDLLCKVCETTGRNEAADKGCKNGSRADYMLCGHKQLCYTNVDQQTDFVSRGCIEPPAYNSMQIFCNISLCNDKMYENPGRTRRSLIFKSMPLSKNSGSTFFNTLFKSFVLLKYIISTTAHY